MNGLDPGIDLSFLRGREVIQIAVGLFQVVFAFDEQVSISVESEFRFSSTDSCVWQPGAPQAAAPTLRLLGVRVEEVRGQSDGTLDLIFSNGARLTILDSSKEFESYNITRPGQTIVV
jgi:hypothetical protein